MSKTSQSLLVLNRDYLPVVLRLIRSAQSSIDVFAFAFSVRTSARTSARSGGDSGPSEIAQALIKKKRENPQLVVRVYLEGLRDTATKNEMTGRFLVANGIEVKYGSTHVKAVGVDTRFLLLGSTNWTAQSIGRNFESNLFTDDLGVNKQFARFFEYYWNGGHHGGIKLKPPLFADQDFLPALLALIGRSTTSLTFSMYFFYHAEIEEALLQASARGVKVQGFIHSHRTFAMSDVRKTAATCARLETGGIRDLFFAPPTLFTHSKIIISDRKLVLIGTGNWIPRDVDTNPQLYLLNKNQALADMADTELQRQIEKFGKRITATSP